MPPPEIPVPSRWSDCGYVIVVKFIDEGRVYFTFNGKAENAAVETFQAWIRERCIVPMEE